MTHSRTGIAAAAQDVIPYKSFIYMSLWMFLSSWRTFCFLYGQISKCCHVEMIMSAQDKELITLYWKLQKLVHTHPRMHRSLEIVKRRLRRRAIPPMALYDVGRAWISR